MTLTIQAVPESLTRRQYTQLLASLGFDPHQLKWLRFEPEGIYAEVKGVGTVVEANTVPTHIVHILIVD